MKVLIVTQSLGRLRIGPRGQTAEDIPTRPMEVQFLPWKKDEQNNQWGKFPLSPELYSALTKEVEVYPWFSSIEKMLAWFETTDGYFFASPVTGERFEHLADYRRHVNELKEQVKDL